MPNSTSVHTERVGHETPTAYLDTPSGISGDMFLGCLVDAGWPLERLRRTVEALDLPAGTWQIHAEKVMRRSIRATLVNVNVTEEEHHRHLRDIRQIIEAARLPEAVKHRAISVFERLADAEAWVHGTTADQIHFHEVGAMDAIIDIVGTCSGVHELGIQDLYAGPVPLGGGWTDSMHGRIPVPAPATLKILASAEAPTVPAPGGRPGELVTPTGASLLAELATFRQPSMVLVQIGHGTGQKEFDWPNVARLLLGKPRPEIGQEKFAPSLEEFASEDASNGAQTSPRRSADHHDGTDLSSTERINSDHDQSLRAGAYPKEPVVLLETNIYDMVPELYGAVFESLFAAGALDVWTTPIGMKKNRPGTLLTVLAPVELEQLLADILLRETTTLGVRTQRLNRYVARREIRTAQTPYGEARVKLKWLRDSPAGASPEYEDCRRLAEETGIPVRTVFEAVQSAANHQFLAPYKDNK